MLRRSLNLARRRPSLTLAAALALASALIAGCRQSAPAHAEANTVVGLGGSFPAPLYTRWSEDYRTRTGVGVNYQGIGSGPAGEQIGGNTADFFGSEQPLTAAQQRAGLYQFPTVVGGITPVVNVSGVAPGQLKLTGALLADIFLGAVTRWNDPRIVALNASLKLPPEPIVVVHRALPSGTTLLFTSYLSRLSPAWKAKAGAGEAVAWPAGVGERGSGVVVAYVEATPGAIGYLGYGYAKHGNLAYVQLQNHDGAFVAPSIAAFAAGVTGANWGTSGSLDAVPLDPPGAGAWPITGTTFILVYKQPPKPEKVRQVLAFFDWAYKNGDATATSHGFMPLPQAVKDTVRKQWVAMIRDASGRPLYKPRA